MNKQIFAIGQQVIIRYGTEHNGEKGTIYNYLPTRKHPYHVRPASYPPNTPGIALTEDEIEAIETAPEAVQATLFS